MRTSARAASAVVVWLMAVLAFALWTLIPVAWIWIASQLQDGMEPSFWIYVLILCAIPATLVLLGRLLSGLDRVHDRLRGRARRPDRAAWLRSMRGERGSQHEVTTLDVVMITSLGLAVCCMAVWFFFFAELKLPG